MTETDPIERMMLRVQKCRELAASLHVESAAKILLEMADEGEADIRRLLAERGERSSTD